MLIARAQFKILVLMILFSCFTPIATTQLSREAAVELDRLDIPDVETMELEVIVHGLRRPWSIAFLPDGELLIVEKHIGVRLATTDSTETKMVAGLPNNVLRGSDSGYLDLALDPDFKNNQLVYLSFVEGTESKNKTAVWKARFDGKNFVEGRVIFSVNEPKIGSSHPGGRMVFLPDKTLLLSVGDGFDYPESAQDMRSHLGKLLRITRDGQPAADNPFIGHTNVAEEIYTSGHRNIQGLVIDPETQIIWSHEHGPRGGDEVNRIVPGANYGWPAITHGVDYDGSVISERSHDSKYARSQFIWSPSTAPSGLTVYRGDKYPELQDRFLVGGLASRSLIQLRQGEQTGLLVEEGRLFTGLRERIRDVRTSPDGLVYLLTDADEGQLLRIVPPDVARMNDHQTDNSMQISKDEPTAEDLGFLIGDWAGEALHFYPREPGRLQRKEESRAECKYILRETYVQCDTVWTSEDGPERRLRLHFNAMGSAYQVLFLYDNWPHHVAYPLTYDLDRRVFRGSSSFQNSDGTEGFERVEWNVSEDEREVVVQEYNHFATDPEDYWARYFKFTWRRID